MESKIIKKDIEEILSEFKVSLKNIGGSNILITGANGMISSYIADVISTFNETSNNPAKLILYNRNKTNENSRLGHLLGNPHVSFVEQDLGKPFEVRGKPDIILHAASKANPLSFKEEPIDTIDANVNGTRTLLDYSLSNPLKQFLFFSSSEVYGNPTKENIPTSETYFGNVNTLGDMACYAESKRFSETLGMSFFRKYGVPFKSLRIFQTFGPGLKNDGKTLANIFATGIKDKKIILRDPGFSKRSLSYISDTTRGILTVLFNGQNGEAYNIGNDKNYFSLREISEMVKEILELKSEIEFPLSYPLGEIIRNRMPDITKIKNLGFSPKVDLKEGLRKLKDYYYEKGVENI